MAWGVYKGYCRIFRCENCLLRKNGDSPLSFKRIGIEKRVSLIDSSKSVKCAGGVQQTFGKSSLSCVYVCKYSYYKIFQKKTLLSEKSLALFYESEANSCYFSIICKAGFTIESQISTDVCLRSIILIPICSIMCLGGRGSERISLEFI